MACPDKVLELVERFERNKQSYLSPSYNETQLRREFIDPFFEALGWDVNNESGKAEAYKDVIHEDAIKIGGVTKAPDYSFRIGGKRIFFLETKKPSVNIRQDVNPAHQVRRYSWSSKLPLAVLTDFEEFAVYDCRRKPSPSDSASVGRILYLNYSEYAEKWGEIEKVFSKKSVEEGAFDQYAESAKGKKGTSEVDDEFLKEIERWRDLLAKNIALRNPGLSVREINFLVQKNVDRILFLRICEDRGIEKYGQLRELSDKEGIYPRLLKIFEKADDKYNSGIFHFKDEKDRTSIPDMLSPAIHIDDKVFNDIFKNLYYPDCPYEFSVIGADILGNVYEQFLGKVIRLTEGHRAKVEEKPEVKKAGGVYYTPRY
ncbi:MAG TPA: restriction endonuclease subunit M, partial [Candidatus Altiarchaeales archaeon]|nr:restriction endonuclease subunit M [Candidatus Altiarchaeales archaeon]